MKVGDLIPVSIQGITVTNAVVKEMKDGVAVLECQGFRSQMSYRTELTNEPVKEPEKQTEIIGTEDQPETPATPESTAPESAAVEVNESTAVEEKPSESAQTE